MALTLNLSPVTELDAVNAMLISIGSSPVNTLEVQGVREVSIARLVLHNTSREVQTQKWSWNTDRYFPISPNADGEIVRPAAALSFDPSDKDIPYIERAGKLYDPINHTFVIGKPVKCDIHWFFAFNDLPQAARTYIARRAGRTFQTSLVGVELLYHFTKEMELEALAALNRDELAKKDTNIFRTNVRANRIAHRRW